MTPAERWAKIRAVIMVSSGNFLEMYDFMIYGYYATAIAAAFFPTGNEFASLMLSLTTFGAGFLMPIGAIVLGSYIARHGRRAGLLLTPGLMAIGTLSIACMPGYASIGLLAPLLVLFGRLLQELSAGAEVGGVSVYLSEIASVRTAGFSMAYSLATAIFGGFTPAISTYLIALTGNRAMPGVWLSGAAAVGLTAALLLRAPDPVAPPSPADLPVLVPVTSRS